MNKKHLKRHLSRFSRCTEWHAAQEDENGKEMRASFISFTNEAMQQNSKLYEYYQTLSDVIHKIKTDKESLYNEVSGCIEWIIEQDPEDITDIQNMELNEGIDASVDVYTSNLTAWLNRSNYNVYYLEEAQNNFGPASDGFAMLASAQYMCHSEIWEDTRAAIVEFLEDKENQ